MNRTLFALLLDATVLLLAASSLCWLLSRRSAATRHLIWAWALRAIVLLPALSLLLPAWSLHWPARAVAVAAPVLAPLAPAQAPSGLAAVPAARRADVSTPTARTSGQAARTAEPQSPHPFAAWLLAAWCTGTVLVLARLARQMRALGLMARRAVPLADPAWIEAAWTASREAGLRRAPALVTSPDARSPFCWGLANPVLVLPGNALSWNASTRLSVLRHEMGHVARRDGTDILVTSLAWAAWWFHPLAWKALTRCRLERERACDDLVLARGAHPADYAERLVALAHEPAAQPVPMMGAVDHLEERLRAILQSGVRREGAAPPVRMAAAVVALGVTCAVGSSRVDLQACKLEYSIVSPK